MFRKKGSAPTVAKRPAPPPAPPELLRGPLIKPGDRALVTTLNWFTAPNGRQYQAVFGTVRAIRTAEAALGVQPKAPSTNWYLEIGNMLIAGCQVHYAVRTEQCALGRVDAWHVHQGQLHEHQAPSRIYFADEPPLLLAGDERRIRQRKVANWCARAFGWAHARSMEQRGIRFAEEAIEAAQAAGCNPAMLHRLIDHVFAKPVGDLRQELGGVGVTLLALAEAAGVSAEEAEINEVDRVLSMPLEVFAQRNQAKNNAGFNVASASAEEQS